MPSPLRPLALAALLVLSTTTTLKADFTYSLSGTFGADLSTQATGLAGGSFSGTYTASAFSSATAYYINLSSWQINLFNPAGNLVFTYAPGAHESASYILGSGSLVFVYDPGPKSATTAAFSLQLIFPQPFNGVGQAIPYSAPQSGSNSIYNLAPLSVTSATSSLASAVPEPASLVLTSGMGLLALGSARRRSRAA